MLKDVTLGQFFPGDSFVHKLDPRVKLLFVVLYIVALFSAKQHPIPYAILLAVLIGSIGISKIPPKSIFKGVKPIVFILVFTAVLNLFYTPGRTLVQIWVLTITYEGVYTAIFMIIRILMLITCTFLLTYTTSPMALTDGIESLLSPLKKVHVPVHEFAMMMSIALRFIPNLIEDTDRIMSSQRARGADFDTGNLVEKAKALIPLLVPLFVSSFRRADELAIAMECRCYNGGAGRTRLNELHMHTRDVLTLIVSCVLCAAMFVLKAVL